MLSLIEELAARHGVVAALKNRSEASLTKIMTCLNRFAMHPAHMQTVLETFGHVLDLHQNVMARSPALLRLMHDLRSRVGAEVKLQKDLHALVGAIDIVSG